jgi:anti-sigma factor RsiW
MQRELFEKPCESFEDRLLAYSELEPAARAAVDTHASVCASCREFLDALGQVDQVLAGMFEGIAPRPLPLNTLVRRPSALPEILDFVGWAAVVAAAVMVAILLAGQMGIPLTLPS